MDEEIISYAVRDAEIAREDVTKQVEMLKTIDMLSSKDETYCQDCEPLFIDTPMSQGWCRCTIHSHFTESWRCIPCVLAEEAKQISSQQSYTVVYDPTMLRKWMYEQVCTIPVPYIDLSNNMWS
jgi:hypothetical protein